MKIKNEIVSIKMGNRHYDFNNLILDEYLKRFVSNQLKYNALNTVATRIQLSCCLIKFDTPLEFTNSSKIKNQDFDICFMGAKYSQNITEKQIVTQYDYDTSFIYDYEKQTGGDNLNVLDYYNRKITAIGFNTTWVPYDYWRNRKL